MEVRKWFGLAALLLLAVAVNVLVWTWSPSSVLVVGPLILAFAAGAAWLVLSAGRRGSARSGWGKRVVGGASAVLMSLLFLAICMAAYALAAAWDVGWDLTQEGRRELSDQTKEVLRTMTQEVEVACIFLDNDDELVSIGREKTLRFLERCQRYTNMIEIEVYDPQTDIVEIEGMGLSHVSTEGTIVVRADGRQKVITLSGGSPRLEERAFTNALVNVLRDVRPKVYYLTGHQERSLSSEEAGGASALAGMLQQEAFDVATMQLDIPEGQVPSDCDILVINNPQGDLHPAEVEAIQAYLERGGRLLLMLEPWLEVNLGRIGREAMRPWLEESWGVVVGGDIAVNDQVDPAYQLALDAEADPNEREAASGPMWRGNYAFDHPITDVIEGRMILLASRTVAAAEKRPEGTYAAPLLRSDPGYWAEEDVAALARAGEVRRNAGEVQGPLPLAQAVEGRTEGGVARVVVVGDSDFVSNGQINVPGNFQFIFNTFNWLSEREDLIAIGPTLQTDPPLVLSEDEKRVVAWVSVLLTVQLVAAAGLIVFWFRRKYR